MDLIVLAQAVWILIAPFLGKTAEIVGEKALEKVGEEAGAKAWEAFEPLIDKKPAEALAKNPQDALAEANLKSQIIHLLTHDPTLAARVQNLLGGQGNAFAVGQGSAAATGQGTAVGTVAGSLTINR